MMQFVPILTAVAFLAFAAAASPALESVRSSLTMTDPPGEDSGERS